MIIPRCGFILTFHSMQFGKNSLMSSFFLMIENICETGVAIVELFLIGIVSLQTQIPWCLSGFSVKSESLIPKSLSLPENKMNFKYEHCVDFEYRVGFGPSKDILSVLPSGLENCPLSTDKKGILVNVDFYRRKMQHKSISRRFQYYSFSVIQLQRKPV